MSRQEILAGLLSDEAAFDQLQSERCRRRRQALADLRDLEQMYRRAADSYFEACHAFIQTFDRTSPAVIDFETLVNKLLEAREGLRLRIDQLAGGSPGLRLTFEGQLLKPSAFANVLVKRHDPEFLQSHPPAKALVARATGIVNKAIARVDRELAEIRCAHGALVNAARLVLERAHGAMCLGLVSRNQKELLDMEALVDLLFPGTVVHNIQPTTAGAIRSLVKKHGVRKTFETVGFGLDSAIERSIRTTLPKAKREALATTAKQLSAELDRWCADQVWLVDCVTKAILGLSFSFASARCGLGGLSAADMARYRGVLDAAMPSTVRTAIAALVESKILRPEDSDLFLYTPSVGRPFREYTCGANS